MAYSQDLLTLPFLGKGCGAYSQDPFTPGECQSGAPGAQFRHL